MHSNTKRSAAEALGTDASRRDIVAKLLGLAAAGSALGALTGCAETGADLGEEGETDEATQALAGVSVRWVDAIGTTPVPNGIGANLRGMQGTFGQVVVVAGYWAAGDGGGGIFYWDIQAQNNVDNGGTYIVSGSSLGQNASGNGWRRIHSGALNVRWFGARGTGSYPATDGEPIQRVIDFAAASRATEIYFPAGRYRVERTLVLPRSTTNPLCLRGAGAVTRADDAGGTIIFSDGADLPPGANLIEFDMVGPTATSSSDFYAFEGITFQSESGGHVFYHSQTVASTRLRHATIRGCRFVSGPSAENKHAVYIQAGLNTTLENVYMEGGHWGLLLENSTRCTVRNLSRGPKNRPWNGVLINGGNRHVLEQIRFDGLAPPSGGWIAQGVVLQDCQQISMTQIDFASNRESHKVAVLNSHSVAISAATVGGGLTSAAPYPQYGFYIDGNSSNVVVSHCHMGDFQVASNDSAAIRVLDGATHVQFKNVFSSIAFSENVSVDDGAVDVFIEGQQDQHPNGIFPFAFSAGVPQVVGPGADPMLDGAALVIRGGAAAGRSGRPLVQIKQGGAVIGGIAGGCAGEVLTIVFDALGATVLDQAACPAPPAGDFDQSYPLVLAGGGDWSTIGQGSTLQLVFDGRYWYETARSANQKTCS